MYKRNPYQQARANTASPGELVVMLYDGIVRFCDRAVERIEAGDTAGAGTATTRALAIIDYLQTILDPNPAPELVERLDALYAFWSRQITSANSSRDASFIRAIRPHVVELRDAWDEAKVIAAKEELLQRKDP
jgi:flagellar protein FliS